MANLISDDLNRSHGYVKDMHAKGEALIPKMNQMAEKVGKKIGDAASDFSDSASGYLHAGRNYVQENPVKGAAIAVASGFVLGSLVYGRRPRT